MKHIILVNPVAGKRNGLKYGIRVQKLLLKHHISSDIYISKNMGDLKQIAIQYSSQDQCRFYSIGGDGTLNEIISGMIGTTSDVVVIPSGTGNDFIRNVSPYKSLRKIVNGSIGKTSTPIDVILVNKKLYSINIVNVGFDSMVAKNVDHFRFLPFISGGTKYNLSILYTLFQNKNYKFKLRYNSSIIKDSFTLVAISNGKYYGGGVCPNPTAIIDDGILNILEIEATTVSKKIKLLPKYKKGQHLMLKEARFSKADHITLACNEKVPVSIDGQIIYTKRLRCELLEKAVNVVVIPTR